MIGQGIYISTSGQVMKYKYRRSLANKSGKWDKYIRLSTSYFKFSPQIKKNRQVIVRPSTATKNLSTLF